MTDSQIATLARGDAVHEERTDGCATWIVTAAGRVAPSSTHHEAWAISKAGGMVARITASGSFHLVADCDRRVEVPKLRVLKPKGQKAAATATRRTGR